jgi:hypothetical protein
MMTKTLYTLQLTNGFFIDFTQLARVLDYAIQNQALSRIPSEAYQTGLGLSGRKTQSLNAVAGAFMLIKPRVLTPTELGKRIYQHNPYLDDIGTLWLLHYIVSSDERYVIWNRLVNRVIPENQRLSTAIARPYFDDLAMHYSENTMNENVGGEIGAVWNAYTEQEFAHLHYLQAESEQIYARGYGDLTIPAVFLAAVLLYRERYAPGAATLDIETLARAPNSPGRVFGLSQRQVHDLLERAERPGSINVETRADLDQVRFPGDLHYLTVMQSYYEAR